MDIGVITIYRLDNYGSVLQAYALKETLKKLGHSSEIIAYTVDHSFSTMMGYFTSSLKDQGIGCTIASMISYISELISGKIETIQRGDKYCKPVPGIFSEFRKNHLQISSQTYTPASLKSSPPKYDAYIVGSDNVWYFEEGMGISDGGARFYLDFVQCNKKKISYAASMGTPSANSRHLNRVKQLIENIDSISVREQSTAKILSKITDHKISVVCDPTLLLTMEEWNELIEPISYASLSVSDQSSIIPPNYAQSNSAKIPYILVYIIHPESETSPAYAFAKELAQKHAMPIKYIGYYFENGKPTYMNVSIPEFLVSFRDASFIVTKTFHGVMFSIIFRRNFYAFTPKSAPTRIVDVLVETGLSERLIITKDEAWSISEQIDYNTPNVKIEQFRAKSYAWLEDAVRCP